MSGSNGFEKATGLFAPKKITGFIEEHPRESALAAMIGASLLTMGAAAPAVAGAAGAAGAAEAGAGAAAGAGSGLLAADYAAMGLGSGALASGAGAAGAGAAAEMGSGLLGADYAAMGMGNGMTAAEAFGPGAAAEVGSAAAGDVGSAGFSGGSAFGDPLAGWGGVDPHLMENGVPDFNTFGAQADIGVAKLQGALSGANWKRGLQALNAAQRYQRLSQSAPAPVHWQRPPTPPPSSGNELAQLAQLFSNPVGQQQLERILRQQGLK